MSNFFKVHTDTLGRLEACIKKSMYGISQKAFTDELPSSLRNIKEGDIIYISEKEVSNNALFGPFYVIDSSKRPEIIFKGKFGSWIEIDVKRTPRDQRAYWVEFDSFTHCILFDKTLSAELSIVWPKDWYNLGLELPSWGEIPRSEAEKLMKFANKNTEEARDFFKRHNLFFF